MNIGIATPFSAVNYGTKLQAYAVQLAVQNIVGSENAEIIYYHHSSDRRPSLLLKKLFSIKAMRARFHNRSKQKLLIKTIGEANIRGRKKAVNSFDSLYKFSRKINGYSDLTDYSKKYDAVICGSDQIWIPDNLKTQYFTLEFFGGKNKIAYAASFGVETIPPKTQGSYRRFLSDFSAISVRENSGADIVRQLLPRLGVQVVCDPTLLHDSFCWNEIAERSDMATDDRYVLCYFLGNNPEHRSIVRKYAERNHIRIKSFTHFKGWVDSDKNFADEELYAASPCDFLKLIRDAECVCTDSMHATVFSLIFNTNFYIFERYASSDSDSRNTRIESLLSRTGTQGQLIHSQQEIRFDGNGDICWEQVNEKIKALREESWKFLTEAIENID